MKQCCTFIMTAFACAGAYAQLRFDVTAAPDLLVRPEPGRVLVVLCREESPEPRSRIGRTELASARVFARDVAALDRGTTATVSPSDQYYPHDPLPCREGSPPAPPVPPGEYYLQAVFDWNRDLRGPGSPGNLYSAVRKVRIDPAAGGTVHIELTAKVPPDALPRESDYVKYVRLRSKFLSDFYGHPIFLRAGVLLPPDGVDFRAFQLVNIYSDTNAFVNASGFERPGSRSVTGEVMTTMRHEVQVENVLGSGDCYTMSGGQWGSWNAVYGPRGNDGKPVPLWDPVTGTIDRGAAEHWKKYDLRLELESHWKTLAPKLRGKLHIWVGDADDYFLNNAVHLLDGLLPRGGRAQVAAGSDSSHVLSPYLLRYVGICL